MTTTTRPEDANDTTGRGDNGPEAPVTRCFRVEGRVQRVMFRQTVIRAMLRRGLVGGATNDHADKRLVHLTICGASDDIEGLVGRLANGEAINDWGALASRVTEVPTTRGKRLRDHQVTTANVDTKQWNPNCTMYI